MAMNTGMKMMMANKATGRESQQRDERDQHGIYRGGYDIPSRENWPVHERQDMRQWPAEDPMSARRQRDSRGRYMVQDNSYVEDAQQIGFRNESQYYAPQDYAPQQMGTNYGNGAMQMTGKPYGGHNKSMSYAKAPHHEEHQENMYGPVDEQKATKWVQRMEAADGSRGGKYKPDQAEQLRGIHCMECPRWEFYVALNMMYSDYCETAKKFGVDRADFYACMAKAFLEDEDAGDNKLSKYMERVAK